MQIDELAARAGSELHEIVLMDGKASAARRFAARPTSDPVAPAEMYDRMLRVIAVRPGAMVITTVDGEADRVDRAVLTSLGDSR